MKLVPIRTVNGTVEFINPEKVIMIRTSNVSPGQTVIVMEDSSRVLARATLIDVVDQLPCRLLSEVS